MDPQSAAPKAGFSAEFVEFAQKYQVLGLAIGIVIGASVNSVVNALVDGLINPLIGLLLPAKSLSETVFVFNGSTFKVGLVLSALINFLIIALLVFLVVHKFLAMEHKK